LGQYRRYIDHLPVQLLKYISPKGKTFYAITNRRILVLNNGRCHEMLHELIMMVRVEQHRQYENMTWDEGQLAFFPAFVGIEDALYLVHLVEQAHSKTIPVLQKSWRGTVIYD
jgi:hypothetical protein